MPTLLPQSAHSGDASESQFSKPSSLAASSRGAEQRDPQSKLEAERRRKRKRNIIIAAVVVAVIVVLAVAIPVGVVLGNQNSSSSDKSSSSGGSGDASPGALPSSSPSNGNFAVPAQYKGTYLDAGTWYDTKDFNTTFTDQKVGGLYVMGLNDTWDDSTRANPNVPALNEKWQYGTQVFRGTNLGGWFCLEPFLSPEFWDVYPESMGIVDEWTLSEHLGADKAKSMFEKHYSTFATETDFAEIAAAGFDHVRIPFSYWAVKTFGDDPYVPMVSFRYLLRSIEWARKHGLRIFLDLHTVPGSQNGWTHSGRVGDVGWLTGPDGALNGERTTEIHKELSEFFSQPRYKNIITMYGLVNEPNMPEIGVNTVIDWYNKAIPTIRNAGYEGLLIMSDGFVKAEQWATGLMQGTDGLVLDIHQYTVYQDELISMEHADKIDYACNGFTEQAETWTSSFGPTMYGEWSYADTECALYQNGVGTGSRWNGTFDGTAPACPTGNGQCSCAQAIANPSTYSEEYKLWLRTFFLAQMDSFDNGWGWFHWTWKADNVEIAPSWTYKSGMENGAMPKTIQDRSWDCSMEIPDFAGAGLPEWY